MSDAKLPPHVRVQSEQLADATQQLKDADAPVRQWMEAQGKDPASIDDHWRQAHAAYERNLQRMDGALPVTRQQATPKP